MLIMTFNELQLAAYFVILIINNKNSRVNDYSNINLVKFKVVEVFFIFFLIYIYNFFLIFILKIMHIIIYCY